MSENETEKIFVSEDELIEEMKKMFLKPYLKESDARLACVIGLYLQAADYEQQRVLKTKGLQKKLRPLIDYMDKQKLERIFSECHKVFFHIKTKTGESRVRYEKVRTEAEKLLLEITDFTSSSEKLLISFFMGFGIFGKIFRQKSK